MKLIKAVNKKTGKVRLFATRSDLLRDPEVAAGRDPAAEGGNVSNALSPRTRYDGWNGWRLGMVEVDEALVAEAAGL